MVNSKLFSFSNWSDGITSNVVFPPVYNKKLAAKATHIDSKVIKDTHGLGWLLLRLFNRMGKVVRIPKIGVVVSEARIMRAILLDPNFSKLGKGASSGLWTPIIGQNGLVNMDGEAHSHLRKQLAPLFQARFLRDFVNDKLATRMKLLKERLLDGEEVDISVEAEYNAALVICALTGVNDLDLEEAEKLISQVRNLLGEVTLTTKILSPIQVSKAKNILKHLNTATIRNYRNNVVDTMPYKLKQAGLTEEDTTAVISAMIIAGTEASISATARIIDLIYNAGLFSYLGEHTDNVKAFLNEGLRIVVPSPVMIRNVEKDTIIEGYKFRKGERLILSNIMACRRGGIFNPFQPIPTEMRQLWFGAGAHFCIGMPLAMSELELILQTLAEVAKEKNIEVVSKRIRIATIAPAYQSYVVKAE